MTNNDELETLIKGLSKAITAQGKVIDKMALRIDTLFEIKEIKENEQKPEPKKEEPIDDIPKGEYIRYKDKHYEFKAAPQIETEKAVQMLFKELDATFWIPKSVMTDEKFQIGLVKWYALLQNKQWILEKNNLLVKEEA